MGCGTALAIVVLVAGVLFLALVMVGAPSSGASAGS
jgi:hypothetical protein